MLGDLWGIADSKRDVLSGKLRFEKEKDKGEGGKNKKGGISIKVSWI